MKRTLKSKSAAKQEKLVRVSDTDHGSEMQIRSFLTNQDHWSVGHTEFKKKKFAEFEKMYECRNCDRVLFWPFNLSECSHAMTGFLIKC